MTGTEPTTLIGVEYRRKDGTTFVASGYTLAAARDMVDNMAACDPTPSRVMQATLSAWEPVE